MINKVRKVAMTGQLSVRISPNATKSSVILQRDVAEEEEIR